MSKNNYKGGFSNLVYNANFLDNAGPFQVLRNLIKEGSPSKIYVAKPLPLAGSEPLHHPDRDAVGSRLSERRGSASWNTNFSDHAKHVITKITAVPPEPLSRTLAQQPRKV